MVKQTLFTEADLSVLDEPKCLTEHQKPFFKCIKRTIFKPLFMTNKGLFVSDKGLFMTDKGLFEPNKGLFGSNKGLSVNKKVKIMTDLRLSTADLAIFLAHTICNNHRSKHNKTPFDGKMAYPHFSPPNIC